MFFSSVKNSVTSSLSSGRCSLSLAPRGVSAFAELHLWGLSFLRLIAAPAAGGLALAQKRVRSGGNDSLSCPDHKRPTSMTHNPVSHHVETRYSHWYVALGVCLTCITAKDSETISHFDVEKMLEVGVMNLFGVWNRHTIPSPTLIHLLTVPSGSK